MKIALDVTPLIYQRGVSRYTSNLLYNLKNYKELKLRLFAATLRQKNQLIKKLKVLLKNSQADISYKIDNIPLSLHEKMWQFGFNKLAHHFPKLDVIHSWDYLQPPDKNIPLVSTIHDLAMLKFPETAHPKILAAHKRSWKILKERQAEIITVSLTTKNDIVEYLDIDEKKIHIIPEALPYEVEMKSESLTEERLEAIKLKLNLADKYILFVGTREPRKNLKRLLKAYENFSKDYQLVIAGEKGWQEDYQLDEHVLKNIKFLGQVTDEELIVLYSEASVFVYPSLYEGFGLPILEAFYHGTPVVTSEGSSMQEVAGNAAVLINPKSVESLKVGIEKILCEDKSMQNRRLQQMLIRLHFFSWQKASRKTIQVYQTAIDNFI